MSDGEYETSEGYYLWKEEWGHYVIIGDIFVFSVATDLFHTQCAYLFKHTEYDKYIYLEHETSVIQYSTVQLVLINLWSSQKAYI